MKVSICRRWQWWKTKTKPTHTGCICAPNLPKESCVQYVMKKKADRVLLQSHDEFDSEAWRDLYRPWNVCAPGLAYITTSIFMIIISKSVITLFIWKWPPACLVCCQHLGWMEFGGLGRHEKLNNNLPHLQQKQIFNYQPKPFSLLGKL